MPKLQVLLRLLCVWSLLLISQLASAHSHVHPETRVGDFERAAEACVRLSALANSSKHQENVDASTAEAVGYPHATKGAQSAANAARLRSDLAAQHILNAQRVGSGLKGDAAHRAASLLSREQLAAGKVFGIRGGDGVQRTLLQTHGGLNGKTGVYEFIIDKGGAITHQRFISGGRITGVPNQVVR